MFWMEFQDFGNHTFTELFDAKKFLFFPFFLLLFFLSPRGGSPAGRGLPRPRGAGAGVTFLAQADQS